MLRGRSKDRHGGAQRSCWKEARRKISKISDRSRSDRLRHGVTAQELRQVLRKCGARQYYVAAGFLRLLLEIDLDVGDISDYRYGLGGVAGFQLGH